MSDEELTEGIVHIPEAAQVTVTGRINEDGVTYRPAFGFMDSNGNKVFFEVGWRTLVTVLEQACEVCEKYAPRDLD